MAKSGRSAGSRGWTLVVSCEHAGYLVPAPYRALLKVADKADLSTHRGWDMGALPVARYLARSLEAPLHATSISRLLVDCNRSTYHRFCLGPSFRELCTAEKKLILAQYYWPHRNRIEKEIKTLIDRNFSVLHLAIHSFTPVLAGDIRRAELGLLYDPSRRNEKRWADAILDQLRIFAPDFRLRRNYPYLGIADGLATGLRRQYRPADYAGFEIEINQTLLAEPGTALLVKRALASSIRSALLQPLK